jgi:hypothetical protein
MHIRCLRGCVLNLGHPQLRVYIQQFVPTPPAVHRRARACVGAWRRTWWRPHGAWPWGLPGCRGSVATMHNCSSRPGPARRLTSVSGHLAAPAVGPAAARAASAPPGGADRPAAAAPRLSPGKDYAGGAGPLPESERGELYAHQALAAGGVSGLGAVDGAAVAAFRRDGFLVVRPDRFHHACNSASTEC